ncbi:hypothetical protein JCM17960_25420 [Magnetospira thiophila]
MACRRISDKEYEDVWSPIRRRLFVNDSVSFDFIDTQVMNNPIWQHFPVGCTLSYGLHSSRKKIERGLNNQFGPLFDTWQELGIESVFVASRHKFETTESGKFFSYFDKDIFHEISAAATALKVAPVEFDESGFVMFDQSGTWALWPCTPYFTWISGDDTFAETYIRLSGGMERLQTMFSNSFIQLCEFLVGPGGEWDEIDYLYEKILHWPIPDWFQVYGRDLPKAEMQKWLNKEEGRWSWPEVPPGLKYLESI